MTETTNNVFRLTDISARDTTRSLAKRVGAFNSTSVKRWNTPANEIPCALNHSICDLLSFPETTTSRPVGAMARRIHRRTINNTETGMSQGLATVSRRLNRRWNLLSEMTDWSLTSAKQTSPCSLVDTKVAWALVITSCDEECVPERFPVGARSDALVGPLSNEVDGSCNVAELRFAIFECRSPRRAQSAQR